MKAILRTYKNEQDFTEKLVEVSDEHEFSDGPYEDTVPFAVGSNQTIIPLDEARMRWEIIDHGIDHSQYFQGCGVSYTEFDHVATGCGETPLEAIDGALDAIAMAHDNTDELIAAIEASEDYAACKASDISVYKHLVRHGEIEDGDDYPEGCELHYYVSIRYSI